MTSTFVTKLDRTPMMVTNNGDKGVSLSIERDPHVSITTEGVGNDVSEKKEKS